MVEGSLKNWLFQCARWSGIIALAERRLSGVPILAYHGVSDGRPDGLLSNLRGIQVPRDQFEHHLRLLARHWRPLGLAEAVEALGAGRALPSRSAVVTFDDGYRNFLTQAAPLLQRHGVPAALFVLTGKGAPRLWQDRLEAALARTRERDLEWEGKRLPLASESERVMTALWLQGILKDRGDCEARVDALVSRLGDGTTPAPDPDRDLLSWDEVRSLKRQGFTIGSHADLHLPLPRRPDLPTALAGSRARLEAELGPDRYALAYPYGAMDDGVAHQAREAGFSCGLSTAAGVNEVGADLFALRRLLIGAADDSTRLRASLSGLRACLAPGPIA